MIGDHVVRRRAGHSTSPVYDHAGIVTEHVEDGVCREVIDVPAWMRESGGAVSPGAFALLADSAIGWAIASRLRGESSMVTTHLCVELFRRIEPVVRSFRADATATCIDDKVGFGAAELFDEAGGVIGRATMRSAQVVARPTTADLPPGRSSTSPPSLPESSVDDELAVSLMAHSESAAIVGVTARRRAANSSGAVHGGVVAMMGERASSAMVATTDRRPPFRPVELAVMYLRRIEADESALTARVDVVAHSRQSLILQTTVVRADAKPAALLRAVYAR